MNLKSLWQLLRQSFWKWNEHNAPRLGAALAYYTVLSLAPLLVIVLAIAGIVFGKEAAQGQIRWEVQDLVGLDGANAIETMVQSARKPAAGILAALLGVVTLLIGASAVFGELRDALNTVWDVRRRESPGILGILKYRFFSFAMVLGIGFLLLVALVVSTLVTALSGFVGNFVPIPASVLLIGNLLISIAVIAMLFALIYKFVPDTRIEWRDVWVGAAATAVMFALGKFLIGLYLGKASVGSAYGAAGSLVIVLVWVYYSAQIFFFGAEFTHLYACTYGSHRECVGEAIPTTKDHAMELSQR